MLFFLLSYLTGMAYNFNKHSTGRIDSLGTPYDYLSMMHYGKTAFGGGRMTIRTKVPAFQDKIGNRAGFSEIDKVQINKMYCSKLKINEGANKVAFEENSEKHRMKYNTFSEYITANVLNTS